MTVFMILTLISFVKSRIYFIGLTKGFSSLICAEYDILNFSILLSASCETASSYAFGIHPDHSFHKSGVHC